MQQSFLRLSAGLLAMMAGCPIGGTDDYMAPYTEYYDSGECQEEELCDDGIDNDCDDLVDEEDPDCQEE